MRRHNVRGFATMESTGIECTFPKYGIVTPIRIFAFLQHGEKVPDGRDAEFRISRMRRASCDTQIDHQCSFLRTCELVLSRLADNDIFRIPLPPVRGLRTDAVG